MKITFKDNFTKNMIKAVNNAADDALDDASKYLLRQANLSVPFDTGKLKNSGKASLDSKKKEAAVSYNTDYAVRVHESVNRSYRQKGISAGSRRRRRAKWLERTLVEKSKQIANRIKNRLKKHF
jgi:hypothetical protein